MILPIKQDDLHGGFAKLSGLLRVEENAIVLEYKVSDDLFEFFESDVKNLKINLRTIEEIKVEKKWFSGRFTICLNQLPKGKHSLCLKENIISLKVKKEELEKAHRIRSSLMLKISEERLRQIEENELHQQTDDTSGLFEFTRSTSETGNNNDGLKNMLRDS